MTEWLGKVLDILRSPKLLVWVVLVAGVALLIPTDAIPNEWVTIRQEYSLWLALLLLGAGSMLGIEVALWLFRSVAAGRKYSERRKRQVQRLDALDTKEKVILREFFLQGRNTIKLPITHPVVEGLISQGIIEPLAPPSEFSFAGLVAPVALSENLRGNLSPARLGLPDGEPTRADIARIQQERPDFIREIIHREEVWEG